VIVNVWVGLSSTPPSAVPPSSFAFNVIVAEPNASAAGVYDNAPSDDTAGPAENRPGFELSVTTKLTT
jgi:hypothetical protein